MKRLVHTDAIAEVFTLQGHQLDPSTIVTAAKQLLQLPESMDPELALLLHTYKTVFDKL